MLAQNVQYTAFLVAGIILLISLAHKDAPKALLRVGDIALWVGILTIFWRIWS